MAVARRLKRYLALTSLFGLLASSADAGTNEGFLASLAGGKLIRRIKNPEVDQFVALQVNIARATEAKGGLVKLVYNGDFFEYVGFQAGDFPSLPAPFPGQIETIQAFNTEPEVVSGSVLTVSAGGTLLGDVSDVTGGGSFGRFIFKVTQAPGDERRFISVVRVQVNRDAEDTDVRNFRPGVFGLLLLQVFPNAITDVQIQARDKAGIVTWKTRDPGFDDTILIDKVDADGVVISNVGTFINPIKNRVDEQALDALADLEAAGIDILVEDDDTIRNFLGIPVPPFGTDPVPALLAEARIAVKLLRENAHIVFVRGLEAGMRYRAKIRSVGLTTRISPLVTRFFNTRNIADLRRLLAHNLDIQRGRQFIAVKFSTNRPVTTNYTVTRLSDSEVVQSGEVNPDGADETSFVIDGLEAGVRYELGMVADLSEQFDVSESFPAEFATLNLTKEIRTRLLRKALRLAGPPFKIVGPESAQIRFRTLLPVKPVLSYGLVTDLNPLNVASKVAQDTESDDSGLYTWESTGPAGTRHSIDLAGDVEPDSDYRYKIEFQLEDDEGTRFFSTAPDGFEQWSRDLNFRTPADGDTLDPELILGPRAFATDEIVVVQFATDVPTEAQLYVGTETTFDTADEFCFTDGEFTHRHSIVGSGLTTGTWFFRIEFTGPNGREGEFRRDSPGDISKTTAVHQPPGGGGSFTTSNEPDTQLPIILSGPTVTSKTHDTAIIEYTTDEPADTEAQFGTEAAPLSESETSGVMETEHKITLSNLTSGQLYEYYVASTDASGNGATESAMAVFTTDPEIDVTAPGFDVDPNISYQNDESATVSWTMDEESTGEVRFGTAADDLGFIRTLPETDTEHEITLTNLEAATQYFYDVASSDLSNNGPSESAVLSFTTDAAPDLDAPVISNLQFEPNDESAVITWTTDEFADSFIDFGTTSGLLDLAVGSVEDVTEHEVVLTNLVANTTYFFTAGSIDRANNPATATAEQSFTTLGSADATPPAVPANLSGTSGNSLAILSWDANGELDFASYTLARRLEGESTFVDIASGLTGLTYTDQGLTNDVAYEYQIKAVDKSNNTSDGSTTQGVTPTGSMAPSLPSNLLRGGEGLTPTFTFTNATPFNTGASLTYTIQVSTQTDFSNVADSESGILSGDTETSWTITRDLTEEVTYYWRVRAVEDDLIGEWTGTREFVAQAVLLVGDFNGDLVVDLDDFFLFADKFGQAATGDAAKFDLAPDGTIDLDDFFLFADKFGTSATSKQWAFAHTLDDEAHFWIKAVTDDDGHRSGDGSITVRVKADQVEAISAFGIVVNYDHTAVTFEAAEEGPGHLLEMHGANAPFFTVFRHRPGQLVIGNALVDGEPVSGHGLLAQLTFRTLDGPTNNAFFDIADAVVAHEGITRRIAHTSAARLTPNTYRLGANFPNPFNPTTTIDYALPEPGPVRLVIYDILGQSVRRLVDDEAHRAGFYNTTWNGTDDANRPVANGLYFYALSAGSFRDIGKMMLLK